jgi:archaellum component FlaC
MKAENIDQIAKWTLNHQTQKISEKYNNIENTIKILNSLMQDFTKKADNFEKNLKKKTRIQEL